MYMWWEWWYYVLGNCELYDECDYSMILDPRNMESNNIQIWSCIVYLRFYVWIHEVWDLWIQSIVGIWYLSVLWQLVWVEIFIVNEKEIEITMWYL